MLKDTYGRTIRYLRVSVTDRCNLRCAYCMPAGIAGAPGEELLSGEETAFVCAQAAALDISRFRITGGEPLVRPDCEELIRRLKRTPGVEEVALTTNGTLLGERLEGLLEAGLDAVNVSLDTTDPDTYRRITGGAGPEPVLDAVRRAAGRIRVKINCVILKGVNEDAPLQLAELARELPADVRFIELMPIGAGRGMAVTPNAEVLARIEAVYGRSQADPRNNGNGPAVYRRLEGFAGRIGLISAVHGKFCDRCNRLRLTCTGELKPCLCYGDVIPLRDILRDGEGGKEERIREAFREAARRKPAAHCFENRAGITEKKEMVRIGG